MEKSQDRLKILKKIDEFERKGLFDQDVEEDLPTIELKPNKIDYLKKKLISKIKCKIAYSLAEKIVGKLTKAGIFNIKEFKGVENLQSLQGGAILTCNHFNAFDSFALEIAFRQAKFKNKKFYRIIREGNYTNNQGAFGFIMRNCYTLPLSSNHDTMRKLYQSIKKILANGDVILVYAEEGMWWNYRKPRPLKKGAFKFALSNNVPVVPCFITMNDSKVIMQDGFPAQEYTINIGAPIYKQENLTDKQNIAYMAEKNFEFNKSVYESFYSTALTYLKEESK